MLWNFLYNLLLQFSYNSFLNFFFFYCIICQKNSKSKISKPFKPFGALCIIVVINPFILLFYVLKYFLFIYNFDYISRCNFHQVLEVMNWALWTSIFIKLIQNYNSLPLPKFVIINLNTSKISVVWFYIFKQKKI